MEGRQDKGCWRNPKALTIVTSMCACASFSFLCVAVATDYWLYAEDRIEFANQTGYYIQTYSGLWKKCTIDVSLPRASIFPMASLVILLVGEIACFVGQCSHRNVLTFISGILFVVGGLCTLVGVIIYISAVTEEASSSKPKSTMDEAKFRYSYGPSFAMTICSFVGCQLTGVLAVYLCIVQFRHVIFKRHQLNLIQQQQNQSKIECANECRPRSSVQTPSTGDGTDETTPGFQDFTSSELALTPFPAASQKSSAIEFATPQMRHKTAAVSLHSSIFSSGASLPSVATPCPLLDYTDQSNLHFPYHYYNPHYFNPHKDQLFPRISPSPESRSRHLSKSCTGLAPKERSKSHIQTIYTAENFMEDNDDSDDGAVPDHSQSGVAKVNLFNVNAQVHASHFNSSAQTKLQHHQHHRHQQQQLVRQHKSRRRSHRSKQRLQDVQQFQLTPQQPIAQVSQQQQKQQQQQQQQEPQNADTEESEAGFKRTTVV